MTFRNSRPERVRRTRARGLAPTPFAHRVVQPRTDPEAPPANSLNLPRFGDTGRLETGVTSKRAGPPPGTDLARVRDLEGRQTVQPSAHSAIGATASWSSTPFLRRWAIDRLNSKIGAISAFAWRLPLLGTSGVTGLLHTLGLVFRTRHRVGCGFGLVFSESGTPGEAGAALGMTRRIAGRGVWPLGLAAVLWRDSGWAFSRVALVVGNGAYAEGNSPSLDYPANDATLMAKALKIVNRTADLRRHRDNRGSFDPTTLWTDEHSTLEGSIPKPAEPSSSFPMLGIFHIAQSTYTSDMCKRHQTRIRHRTCPPE